MASVDVRNFLRALRGKPAASTDQADVVGRGNRYGEKFVVPIPHGRYALADEGSYFTVQNATDGTGVAIDAAHTSFSDTNAFFVFKNNAAAGSGIRCYLDYLKLVLTASTTAIASVDFVTKGDVIIRAPSTAANGTSLTPVNVNMDDATGSVAQCITYNGNAMTVPAASAGARILGHAHAATGLGFAGDLIIVKFASEPDGSTMGLTAVRASGPSITTAHHPPVVLGPQQTAVIHRFSLTEAAAVSYNLELAWYERAA